MNGLVIGFILLELLYDATILLLLGEDSLTMTFSSTFSVLLISRLITGFGIGIGNMIASLYICEISLKFHRLIFESNGRGWRWMAAVASVPPLLQLFGLLFVSETSRFLVKQGDFENAKKVLSKIYPNSPYEFLNKEIEVIHAAIA
ncbi:10608_t:CDS:2 [Dentiscutata heterogama]|uniref:10608_t:CDS:1 n=1 Tax=Dentiscutata heterogama TaxID=1316150 RepID=A0ACA9K102_9GLOM|nr:10608_t:CDS:2 [Dentiscutata heterogama]